MSRRILITFLLGFMLIYTGTCLAQTSDDAVAAIIRQKLGGTQITGGFSVGACRISSLTVIPELYKRREYRPIWVNAQSIEQLVRAIENTYQDGLDPEDYHLQEIRRQWSMTHTGTSLDPSLAASLDLLLTDALVLLANHSNCGKQDPLTYHPQWNLDRKIADTDPVAFIEHTIASPSLVQTINAWKIKPPVLLPPEGSTRGVSRNKGQRRLGSGAPRPCPEKRHDRPAGFIAAQAPGQNRCPAGTGHRPPYLRWARSGRQSSIFSTDTA